MHNPTKVLYGRLPDFHLSDLGREMAVRAAEALAGRDLVHVVSSPLERARETAEPVAAVHGLEIATDADLIEAGNVFQGRQVAVSDLRHPRSWRYLYNPFTPSWGEPYVEVAARMRRAVAAAREAARGHEALCVSHQLPIWVARLDAEQRRFVHDPRRRQCALASLTSFAFDGDRLVSITYTEPAADLVARSSKGVGA